MFFFFKQKTAYEMRISDWSSDVCSSDLPVQELADQQRHAQVDQRGQRIGLEGAEITRLNEVGGKAQLFGSDLRTDRRAEHHDDDLAAQGRPEIGRASCRERVCQYV